MIFNCMYCHGTNENADYKRKCRKKLRRKTEIKLWVPTYIISKR